MIIHLSQESFLDKAPLIYIIGNAFLVEERNNTFCFQVDFLLSLLKSRRTVSFINLFVNWLDFFLNSLPHNPDF